MTWYYSRVFQTLMNVPALVTYDHSLPVANFEEVGSLIFRITGVGIIVKNWHPVQFWSSKAATRVTVWWNCLRCLSFRARTIARNPTPQYADAWLWFRYKWLDGARVTFDKPNLDKGNWVLPNVWNLVGQVLPKVWNVLSKSLKSPSWTGIKLWPEGRYD